MYLQNRPTWCFDSAFSLAAQQIYITPVTELLLVHASEWSEAYLDTVSQPYLVWYFKIIMHFLSFSGDIIIRCLNSTNIKNVKHRLIPYTANV